jgi:hypothetical protein
MIVAPQLLWEVANDALIPKLQFFAVTHKGEPVRALIFTAFLSGLIGLSGSLDLVAPFLTMCFLVMWAMVNMCSFVMCLLLPPTWRPHGIRRKRWRVFYTLSGFLGAVLSIVLMFLVLWYVALVIIFVCTMLYIYVSYMRNKVAWGSGLQGIKF